jgi:hypothetical protein
MHRYIIPLDAEGYRELLVSNVRLLDVVAWQKRCDISINAVGPCEIDLAALEALWSNVTFPMQIFSLYRNDEFWRWRYRDNVGFEYLMFGDPQAPGVVVGRIEKVDLEDNGFLNALSVFRIVEIIPRNIMAWAYEEDEDMVSLLSGVLKWAQCQGCVAADFFCSHTRFGGFLKPDHNR